MKQKGRQSPLALYAQLLLRWGWFVLLLMVTLTICSALIPDSVSPNAYQATLQVQIQSTSELTNSGLDLSLVFFSQLFVSPDTLNLLVPKYRALQLSGLQALVTATPVTGTNIVLLNVAGETPQAASALATDTYHAVQQELYTKRSFLITKLNALLQADLNQCESNIANATTQLQNLIVAHQQSSSQYRQINAFYQEQLKRAETINTTLATLGQDGFGSNGNGLFTLGTNTPAITTINTTIATQSQRLLLSPLIGFIMGMGAVLLAGKFSNRLPLLGKDQKKLLSSIGTSIPALSGLHANRLEALKQVSLKHLLFLHQLLYKANGEGKQLKLITITSPKGQEGKSTIALSLALATARRGLSTLLIDMNPQHPVLHRWLNLSGNFSTLDLIRSFSLGTGDFIDTTITFLPNLHVLPLYETQQGQSSIPSGNPFPVDGLRPFMEAIRLKADLVIFDGPPLLNDVSAAPLVTLSDAVLLVIDAKKSKASNVVEAEAFLSKMGVSYVPILNRAQPKFAE